MRGTAPLGILVPNHLDLPVLTPAPSAKLKQQYFLDVKVLNTIRFLYKKNS